MALSHSSNLVTGGLVLCLDAANPKSYPGSGTTWTDLSGNSNNVTLSNGPTYSSANRGYITFDGVDDYANFFAPSLASVATVEMWCKWGASYTGKMMFSWTDYTVYTASGHFGYNTYSSDVYGVSSATVTSLGLVSNWKHYVFEMKAGVSYTNNKIYVNAEALSLSQQLASGTIRTFGSGNGRIAQSRADSGYSMSMDCAYFAVYNRALSQTEVNRNFAAFRGRFGI
jgi:hypothetical protein